MRVLITGGAGFLGSAICNKLSQLGHEVVAFDNFSRKSHLSSLDAGVQTFDGDVRNLNDLIGVCNKYEQFDALWHLAYINGTATFYTHPELVLEVGVKGAMHTLDTAILYKIKDYILFSSSEVYNQPIQIPTPESERLLIPDVYNPRFSYSGGKIISELLAIHYGSHYGLNVKTFRPHNVYGPNMGLEHVIPEITKKIVCPTDPVFVDNKLVINIQGNGEETRSFCYIEDAVDEAILASSSPSSDTSPIYNIGVENEVSILQLVNLISDILKIPVEITFGSKIAGGTNRRCPSMLKMDNLGYVPKYSLRDGVEKTVNWYKEHYLK